VIRSSKSKQGIRSEIGELNKSRIARDFYRKVFNDNLINLQDSDARKEIVDQFFDLPENKKAGWHKTKDRRFFRLAFSKVAKENNFNPMSVGVTPEPHRSKTQKGSTQINVKTKQKNVPPLKETITTEQLKQQGKSPLPIPSTPTLQDQQAQATYYSAQSVGQIFETFFNIFSSRLEISPLNQNERIALGEAWSPIFNEYFSGQSKWVMPVIITAPIVLQRVAEFAKAKKERELKEKYNMDDIPPPKEPAKPKQKSKWDNMSHGKTK
tara:strand:+ start:578 stop:1378 length:801 start_codon:yes stop_codon:yes gene_type:complete